MEYQARMGCPDLGAPAPFSVPIPDSDREFADCPAYYLRTAALGMPAAHLAGGIHPAQRIAPIVDELEAGAVRYRQLPPKVVELARLLRVVRAERSEARMKKREAARG